MVFDKFVYCFDFNFIKNVIEGMGFVIIFCNCEVFGVLICYIYDFVCEVEFIVDEWMEGVKFVNVFGEIYYIFNKICNEIYCICDVFGFEFFVDEIVYKIIFEGEFDFIFFFIFGFFWFFNVFFCEFGGEIFQDGVFFNGCVIKMYGVICDIIIGQFIFGVVFDIW